MIPSGGDRPSGLDTVVDIKAQGISPLHEHADEFVVALPLPFEHLLHRGAKQRLQGFEANVRHGVKAAVRHEQVIGRQQVQYGSSGRSRQTSEAQ